MSIEHFGSVRVENQYGYFVNIDHDVNLWIKQLPSWYWTAENPECGTRIDCTVHADWTQSMLNLSTASQYAIAKGFVPIAKRCSSSVVSCVSSAGVLESITPDNYSESRIMRIPCMEHRDFTIKKNASNITITTVDITPPKKVKKWPTKIIRDPRFHKVHTKPNDKLAKVDNWMINLFKDKVKMRKLYEVMQKQVELSHSKKNK